MTCCADDIRFIGFICKTKHSDEMKNNRWVMVTATVRYEYFPAYHGEGAGALFKAGCFCGKAGGGACIL